MSFANLKSIHDAVFVKTAMVNDSCFVGESRTTWADTRLKVGETITYKCSTWAKGWEMIMGSAGDAESVGQRLRLWFRSESRYQNDMVF